MDEYRIKNPIPAMLDKPNARHIPVILPVGAIVRITDRHSTALFGMVGGVWEGRHYSLYPKHLAERAERLSTALEVQAEFDKRILQISPRKGPCLPER